MSRPVKSKSLEGASATGAGDPLNTGGRITISLFAVTDTDPGTLEVELDGSMDGDNWVPINSPTLETSDFDDVDGNGSYAAMFTLHGVAVDFIRARISGYSSAGNVDVWVSATDNPNSTKSYREIPGT